MSASRDGGSGNGRREVRQIGSRTALERLLETAEAQGLTPAFSCRNGVCGSCATRKISGEVTYRTPPMADHAEDEVLICCSVPAAGTEVLELDL